MNDLPKMKKNALGHYVPVELIDPKTMAEDDLVNELHAQAEYLQYVLSVFKFNCLSAIAAHVNDTSVELGVDEAQATAENDTFTNLASYDGKKKVKIAKGTRMSFGIEMKAAQTLIRNVIREKGEGLDPLIGAMLEKYFPLDQEKDIDPANLWALSSLHVEGEKQWNQAMKAIRASVRYEFEKPYLRFYRRDKDKAWEMVSLDLASLHRFEGPPPAPAVLPGMPEPVRPIRDEAGYQATVAEIEALMKGNPSKDGPEGERKEVLGILANDWENRKLLKKLELEQTA